MKRVLPNIVDGAIEGERTAGRDLTTRYVDKKCPNVTMGNLK